jgi:hypothetical protein
MEYWNVEGRVSWTAKKYPSRRGTWEKDLYSQASSDWMRGWESVRTWDWVKGDIRGIPVRWQTNGRGASHNHGILDWVPESMSLMASKVKCDLDVVMIQVSMLALFHGLWYLLQGTQLFIYTQNYNLWRDSTCKSIKNNNNPPSNWWEVPVDHNGAALALSPHSLSCRNSLD